MTTHKQVRSTEEALTLALEALKAMMQEFQGYDLPYGSKAYVLAKDACLFAEKALALVPEKPQPEQICGFDVVLDESMPPNTFKLAQPAVASEQRSVSEHLKERSSDEPVVYKKARIHWLCQEWKEDHLSDINFVESIIAECLTPPQRDSSATPRKPLTDEEIYEAINNEVFNLLDFVFEFGTQSKGIKNMVNAIARAIEAAHGIVGDTHE